MESYANAQLLARGATQDMIDTFHLTFTDLDGIYAWADDELFNEFSGDGMKEGDTWKIYLGRRITLEEDDLDGSLFIETLIEEAVLFPQDPSLVDPTLMQWKTYKESPGVWITKPFVIQHDDVDWEHVWEDSDDPDVTDITIEFCG